MTKNKYFDKYANITTNDGKTFNIRKIRIYVGGKINYYGKQYIISPKNSNNNELKIVNEVYSLESNRLRFLGQTFKRPVVLDTIEHSSDNSEEKPIKVITEYDEANTEIISIPNIVRFESDLIIYEDSKFISKVQEEQNKKNNGLFRSLILKKEKRDS